MNKTVVFCVETNKASDTDTIYIKETLSRFYKEDRKTAFRYVYMDSKAKAKSPKVTKDIKSKIQGNERNAYVVLCVDADRYFQVPEDKAIYEDIRVYCETKGYKFVFFCRDVEDVYWGCQIDDKEKTEKAVLYKRQHRINTLSESSLKGISPNYHTSNLLNVLDMILERK